MTITEEYRKNVHVSTNIKKFNRNGYFLYTKSKTDLLNSSWNNTIYSYDSNGKLQIKKEDDYVFVLSGGFVNQPKYEKYKYDNQSKLCEIKEYTNSDDNITSISSVKRTDFGVKITRNEQKFDFSTKRYYDDVTIINIYKNRLGKANKIVEIKGKRVLETSYVYNKYGQRIKIQKEDKVIFEDSTIVYDYSDKTFSNPKYMYQTMNTRVVENFEYDKFGNVIHYNRFDKTHNEEQEEYYEYVYDAQGNWIERYVYDSLHELVEFYSRKIEYYPKDIKTGIVDYSWEQKDSPSLEQYYYERER